MIHRPSPLRTGAHMWISFSPDLRHCGAIDSYFRCEPDGDATRLVFDSNYGISAKLPVFVNRVVTSGWIERNHRKMLADFKALAEAKTPAHA